MPEHRPLAVPRLSVAALALGALLGGGLLSACGSRAIELPAPRPLITKTGERLRAEPERLAEIDAWVRAQLDSINVDPSFMIISRFDTEERQLWDGMSFVVDSTDMQQDTVVIHVEGSPPEVTRTYNIYAHLHLMKRLGRDDVWLPEAAGADGYELEKAIVTRVSDAWLYARSIFDAIPYSVLDELMYSNEAGYLDAYLLTARQGDFSDEYEAWMAANPGQKAEYMQWFERIFERPPPGERGDPSQGPAGR